MIRLDRIYTRGGDSGQTSLGRGQRVPKHNPRVQAYGTVEEANAILGLVRLHLSGDPENDALLARIQNDLFDLGADLCTVSETPQALRIIQSQVDWLEQEIDRLNQELPPLTSFILPGGTAASAYIHLARTVIRRAERQLSELAAQEDVSPLPLKYLNRLSDFLFVLGRVLNQGEDTLWVPGAHR